MNFVSSSGADDNEPADENAKESSQAADDRRPLWQQLTQKKAFADEKLAHSLKLSSHISTISKDEAAYLDGLMAERKLDEAKINLQIDVELDNFRKSVDSQELEAIVTRRNIGLIPRNVIPKIPIVVRNVQKELLMSIIKKRKDPPSSCVSSNDKACKKLHLLVDYSSSGSSSS